MGREEIIESLNVSSQLQGEFYRAAMRTADWLVRNQITDPHDANHGRFIEYYVPTTGQVAYSTNWTTGAAVMGLLMAYHRTENKQYLEAALRGGEYVTSLQVLDERRVEYLGTFREETPQTTWNYPRDALTAAWALLWLYDETRDEGYLYRVKLFIRWFIEQAMAKGWPAWQFSLSGGAHLYLQGSFHGGDGAFFYDYFRVTGDSQYLHHGLRFIADYLLDRFLGLDGKYKIIYDAPTDRYLDNIDSPHYPIGWQRMHRYNDDFAAIALLDAHLYYGETNYIDRAEAFARWLMSEQRPDGGYGNPDVPPAAATSPILLLDLFHLTHKAEYLESAIKAGNYLMKRQELDQADGKAYGGFYGYSASCTSPEKVAINLRTTSYALIALLKLEGKEKGPYYSSFDRNGDVGISKSAKNS